MLATPTFRNDVPVAVVGIGCRFPGGVRSASELWQLLLDARDVVREVPTSRFDANLLYAPDAGTPGRITCRQGAFLDDVDLFDPGFFGISPREAERMDPAQRLLLEVAVEALEDAAIPLERASQAERTGVFVGMMANEYEDLMYRDPERLDVLGLNGASRYGAAGRIAHCFGLGGPTMTVDTACSSSLVSTHLACQSIRTGEATLALAGGAHLILGPEVSICLANGNVLARDGRCKFGDARADGFGRGEGVGLVVLKALDRALEEGDRIYAVIRGSAVGSFGPVEGAMARPNSAAQQATLRFAYAHAGVDSRSVQYVEAHGTGTIAGDSAELDALAAVLGEGRPPNRLLAVGSIKTNMAHSEGASGVAGLIKLVLALRHQFIPRSLHFETPNPQVNWNSLPLFVQKDAGPWPAWDGPRRGALNSFGLSGTNAHMIVEEPPAATRRADPPAAPYIFTLSAKTQPALRACATRFTTFIDGAPATSLHDIAWTAAAGRTHHLERLAIVGGSKHELSVALDAFLAGHPHPGVVYGVAGGSCRKLAFVFPGQGSQWLGMGRELLARSAAFRASIEESDAAIRREIGWSLIAELMASEADARLARIDVVQPVLFALQVALAAEWQSLGVKPDALVGHSMGEIAAAHVAGALTLDDAVRIVTRRSALLRRVSGRGAMAMVELSIDECAERIAPYADTVAVAVSNSRRSTVLSGDPDALEEILAGLERDGVFCRRVKVDVASHSPQMDPLRDDLLGALDGIAPRAGSLPIQSTVTLERTDGSGFDARYWVDNLREPVRFGQAVEGLVADGHTLLVEISPHPILLPALEPAVGAVGAAVSTLRREQPEHRAMLESLAVLYARGYPVDWRKVLRTGNFVALPSYPFERERYWIPQPALWRAAPAVPANSFINAALRSSADPNVRFFEAEVGPRELPFLADHRVEDAIVFPAAAYVEMALAAGTAALGETSLELENVVFHEVLAFPEGARAVLQLVLTQTSDGRAVFRVSSVDDRAATAWRLHASGAIRAVREPGASEPASQLFERGSGAVARAAIYERFASAGLVYGPVFQGIAEARTSGDTTVARIEPSDRHALEVRRYRFHPAILDACLQVLALHDEGDGPRIPVGIERLRFHPRPQIADLYTCARGDDLVVVDAQDRVVLDVAGVRRASIASVARDANRYFAIAFDEAPIWSAPDRRRPAADGWLIVGAPGDTGYRALGDALAARGERVIVTDVDPSDPDAVDRAMAAAGPCRGVVSFVPSDDQTAPLDGAIAAAASVLHVVQALGRAAGSHVPRVWIVSRGAQILAGDADGRPTAAAAVGLARTVACEHAELRTTRIDLSASPTELEIQSLAAAMVADDSEEEVVLRGPVRRVARVVRRRPPPAAVAMVRPDGTYLITGGLGALGLTAARWLAARGAGHLVLVGRRAPDDAARAVVAAIEAAGGHVSIEACDVADARAVAGLFARIGDLPPVAGVIHAAGILDDALLEDLTVERLRSVMAAKVAGAWNLHSRTQDSPLDFFVLYSSAAGLLGTPGQANYAAANAYLDALARWRRECGLPALSMNWGAFAGAGLAAARANRGDRLAGRGMRGMDPDASVTALERLLGDDASAAQIAVMDLNLRQWIEFYPQAAASTFFRALAGEARRTTAVRSAAAARLARDLRAAAPAERRRRLEAFLREQVSFVLRIPQDRLDSRAPLKTLGLDSLMGLELRNRIEAGLGLTLPATLLWSYPHVAALADHLAMRFSAEPQAAAAARSEEPDREAVLARSIAALDESEKRALLESTLAEIEERL